MNQEIRRLSKPISWGMSLGLSLILGGCGGDATTLSPGDQKASPSTATATETNSQTKTGGKAGAIAPGGELSREERKAAKLREKNAAGK